MLQEVRTTFIDKKMMDSKNSWCGDFMTMMTVAGLWGRDHLLPSTTQES